MEKSLESVKQDVRSVLLTYKTGTSLNEFLKVYQSFLGSRLPSRQFGYTLDIDFLHSIPDVVHVELDRNGVYQLRALANKDTEHIKNLVQKARTVKTKANSKSNGSMANQRFNMLRASSSTAKGTPFIPAVTRAEIIEVVKQYPEGISYFPFLLAFQKKFNRAPNFSFLSIESKERFRQIASAVPELETKLVRDQEKLIFVPRNDMSEKSTSIERRFPRLQPLNAKDKSDAIDVSAIPEHMKYNMEKVLKRHQQGVLAVHFPILYEKFTNTSFDLHDLGYNSLLDLVDALPDIFERVISPENPNDWILFHVDFSDKIADARQASNVMKTASSQISGSSNNSYNSKVRLSHSKLHTSEKMASPGLQYERAELPVNSSSQFFRVFISSFINPSLFWFQLQTEEELGKLQNLESEMERFYNSLMFGKHRLNDEDILIGSHCAVFLSGNDGQWFRCAISSILNMEDVKVFLVDYGSWETVSRKNLYYLKCSFMDLPAQAFQAKLAFVETTNKDGIWEKHACDYFLQLSNRLYILAQVASMENNVVSTILRDEIGGDVYFADALQSKGFANIVTNGSGITTQKGFAYDDVSPENTFLEQSYNNEIVMKVSPDRLHHPKLENQNMMNPKETNAIIKKLEELKLPENKRSVRRILLDDGCCIHILVVNERAFVSGDDLCNLLWKGKNTDVLAYKLDLKDTVIPTLLICKEKYEDLFAECEKYNVGGFNRTEDNFSVVLYPLKDTLKVLNVFGHPSLNVRKILFQEIQEFNPNALVWSKFEVNGECYENVARNQENSFYSLCIYDLNIMLEGLECKRIKIDICHEKQPDEHYESKIKQVETKRNIILKRIKELEEICLLYTEELF